MRVEGVPRTSSHFDDRGGRRPRREQGAGKGGQDAKGEDFLHALGSAAHRAANVVHIQRYNASLTPEQRKAFLQAAFDGLHRAVRVDVAQRVLGAGFAELALEPAEEVQFQHFPPEAVDALASLRFHRLHPALGDAVLEWMRRSSGGPGGPSR